MIGWIYLVVVVLLTYLFNWLIDRYFPASSDYQDIEIKTISDKIEFIKRKFEYNRKNPHVLIVLAGYLFVILTYIYYIINSQYPIIGGILIGLFGSYALIWFHKVDEARAYLFYCVSFFFIFKKNCSISIHIYLYSSETIF